MRVQSTNRPPTLSLYILLLIFRLLLQSGDVEANPGPTFSKQCLSLFIYVCLYNIHIAHQLFYRTYTCANHVYDIVLIICFVASILTLDDLNSVYKNLIKAAGNWFNLGLDLGLGFDILNNIKDEHRDNQTCLRDMIAARLKTGPLTYSEICQSLRASTVARNDVVEAIEEACTGMNSHDVTYDHAKSISMNSQ